MLRKKLHIIPQLFLYGRYWTHLEPFPSSFWIERWKLCITIFDWGKLVSRNAGVTYPYNYGDTNSFKFPPTGTLADSNGSVSEVVLSTGELAVTAGSPSSGLIASPEVVAGISG